MNAESTDSTTQSTRPFRILVVPYVRSSAAHGFGRDLNCDGIVDRMRRDNPEAEIEQQSPLGVGRRAQEEGLAALCAALQGNAYAVIVLSRVRQLSRNPGRVMELITNAVERGIRIIVAAEGIDTHECPHWAMCFAMHFCFETFHLEYLRRRRRRRS